MTARDDYPTLVRMLDAFVSDDPDTIDIRIFGSGVPLAKALDEIDDLRAATGLDRLRAENDWLRATIESGRRAYAQLLARYDVREAYLADVARQLADCLVRKRS